jgi:hypothetical protein
MFSTLVVRVQTIARFREGLGWARGEKQSPPAARYYGENRSGNAGGSRGVVPLD